MPGLQTQAQDRLNVVQAPLSRALKHQSVNKLSADRLNVENASQTQGVQASKRRLLDYQKSNGLDYQKSNNKPTNVKGIEFGSARWVNHRVKI